METASTRDARFTPRRLMLVGAIGGMLSGMMMGATEMFYGWASPAHTFWDPLMAIWSWVGGRNHFGAPGNHVGPIILGLGGHVMNAMVFGIIFAMIAAAFATALRRSGASWPTVDVMTIMLGVGWGLLAWVIMRYGILPLRANAEPVHEGARQPAVDVVARARGPRHDLGHGLRRGQANRHAAGASGAARARTASGGLA